MINWGRIAGVDDAYGLLSVDLNLAYVYYYSIAQASYAVTSQFTSKDTCSLRWGSRDCYTDKTLTGFKVQKVCTHTWITVGY